MTLNTVSLNVSPYLVAETASYLSEKHSEELKKCICLLKKFVNEGIWSSTAEITHVTAIERIHVLRKRVEKRKREIAHIAEFIKECESMSEKIESLRFLTHDFIDFIASLKNLALRVQKAFNDKGFDKAVKTLYPQMVEELAMLLKERGLQKDVEEMDEHSIKTDLLSIMAEKLHTILPPEKGVSAKWIAVLEGFYYIGMTKLLNFKETTEVLSIISSNCQDLMVSYCNLKKKCEGATLTPSTQEVVGYINISIFYFSGLQVLIQKTRLEFDKKGSMSVMSAFPQMMHDLARLLKDAELLEITDKIPNSWLKEALTHALHNEQIPREHFDVDAWISWLGGFVTSGKHALMQHPSATKVAAMINEINP